MTFSRRIKWLSTLLSLSVALLVVGCTKVEEKKGDGAQAKNPAKVEIVNADKKGDKPDHDHSDWWCAEHGIPEDICGLCNTGKDWFKQKKAAGDWCADHKRLKTQCFKCDPTLYEREFEPMYVAKYNKKPERPPENQFKK